MLTSGLQHSAKMDLVACRKQILTSNQSATEKAAKFLLVYKVSRLSKESWQQLVDGIPEDVLTEIG